jgi:hypothetical protein
MGLVYLTRRPTGLKSRRSFSYFSGKKFGFLVLSVAVLVLVLENA